MSRMKDHGLDLQLLSIIIALVVAVFPGSAGDLARQMTYSENGIIFGAIVLLATTLIWRIYPGWWLAFADLWAAMLVALAVGRIVVAVDSPGHIAGFEDRLWAILILGVLSATLLLASQIVRGSRDASAAGKEV